MITTYILKVEEDLNFDTIDVSNRIFEFYTPDNELGSVITDEWGKNKNE